MSIVDGRSYSLEGPQCPKCGSTFTPDEGCYFDEAAYTSDECHKCGTEFTVEVHHSTSWTCEIKEPASADT